MGNLIGIRMYAVNVDTCICVRVPNDYLADLRGMGVQVSVSE